MTESEYSAAQSSGAIENVEPEETAPASSPTDSISQFIPLLTQLQSTQRCLTAAPTNIPQTFQDQIQFVFDGTHYFLYLYFNNQWNSFPVIGGGGSGVTQILASSGISISPGGGTGIVTISCTIDDATLPMSDITTNNASITQHGFVPKLPNDASKFLNGVGGFSAPSGGGGGTRTAGLDTHTLGGSSSTQVIPHGLGTTPSFVRCSTIFPAGGICSSIFDGTNQNCAWVWIGSAGNGGGTDPVAFIRMSDAGNDGQLCTITVDATNITLTWSVLGTGGSGTLGLIWEAEA